MEVLLYEWRPVAHHQERVNARKGDRHSFAGLHTTA
jgi:hypothetical protein